MEIEELNRKKWNKKKVPIVKNIKEGIENREKALRQISYLHGNLDKATDKIKEELSLLRPMGQIYWNNQAYLRLNPVMDGSVSIMTKFSEYDVEYTRRVVSEAAKIKTNTDMFLGTLNISGSMTASNMSAVTTYLASNMENNEGILLSVEQIKEPSFRDRRNDLIPKLRAIETRFSTKLEGAWQTLQDGSKSDRFLQAASSARELISDLLSFLAPDDEVIKTTWFNPERDNGLPTQRQRARYVMLGKNDSLEEEQLTTIYLLMDSIRYSYTKLSPIAHRRDYESDLQAQTESLINQCQIYLLKLLDNRKLYFEP